MIKKLIGLFLILVIVAIAAMLIIAPKQVDKSQNMVIVHDPYKITPEAQALHDSLIVGDWHIDSLLWSRDLNVHNDIGHSDIPRLQKGNVGLQMFTMVTKSPVGLNYSENDANSADNITRLALIQRWPIDTWSSLTARALHQANKLYRLEQDNQQKLMVIKSQRDLAKWQKRRQQLPRLIGALIGTEGSHALDGKLENVQLLYDNGFRMMSLQHFFDNKLGGSLHGQSQTGLTDFGKQVVSKINQLNIILDVSHSSEAAVEDVLNITTKPLVVSHTGFKGHCDTNRNISDVLMQKIAAGGGLIAVGYWDAAACGEHPNDIASSIKYGIKLVGENHISLGSDFDGSVTTAIDNSELVAITQALIDADISETQIRKVMGGNMLRFLQQHLPRQ